MVSIKFYNKILILLFVITLGALNGAYSQKISELTYPVTLIKDTSVHYHIMKNADTLLGESVDSVPSLNYLFPGDFSFNFAGSNYRNFTVSPLGWIKLGNNDGYSYSHSLLNKTNAPIIAPFWLNSTNSFNGVISCELIDSQDTKIVVINWSLDKMQMQVWLWENGQIDFIYPVITSYNSTSLIGISSVLNNEVYACTLNPDYFWRNANPIYSTDKETIYYRKGISNGSLIRFSPLYIQPQSVANFSVSEASATTCKLNWIDSSTTETFFSINVSTDSVNYKRIATLESNSWSSTGSSYSYKLDNLVADTKYFISVEAANEGGNPSTPSVVIVKTLETSLKGIKKIPGDFNTITEALNDIKSNGLAGNLILELQNNYKSDNEVFPITFDSLLLTNQDKLLFIVTAKNAAGITISGNHDSSIILLDNATHIFINGSNNNDTSKNLVIINTSNRGSAVIFKNGASDNTIRNCILRAKSVINYGIVHFGSTNNQKGNSNNAVIRCSISSLDYDHPKSSVSSLGSIIYQNKNNLIQGNYFHDILRSNFSIQSIIIDIANGNTGWTIDSNSFFQTKAMDFSPNKSFYCIRIKNDDGENFKITNNFIGGSEPFCKGKAFNIEGTTVGSPYFIGISTSLKNISGSYNVISNNSFNRLSLSLAQFIEVKAGFDNNDEDGINYNANFTITENIIGEQDSLPSIFIKNYGYGIKAWEGYANLMHSEGKINISKNNIGGIIVGDSLWETKFIGIGTEIKHVNISDNIIGSKIDKNSIIVNNGNLIGIHSLVFGDVNITGNVISNLTHNIENPLFSCIGIQVGLDNGYIPVIKQFGNVKIEGNTIKSIFSQSYFAGGIRCSTDNVNFIIQKNTIYDIEISGERKDYYQSQSRMFGIIAVSNNVNCKNIISQNLVHSIICKLQDSYISGIISGGYDVSCINNIIRLGKDFYGKPSSPTFYTMRQIQGLSISSSFIKRVFHNTVYIYGDSISCGDHVFLISADSELKTNGYDSICNNLLFLDIPSAKCINRGGFVFYYGIKKNNYINHNLYYCQNGISPDFRKALSVDEWKRETGFDINSIFKHPKLKNPGDDISKMDLSLMDSSVCEGNGIALASVEYDFYGNKRNSLTGADIGAIAGNFIKNDDDVTAPIIIVEDSIKNVSEFTNRILENVKIKDIGTGVPTTGKYIPRIWFRKLSPLKSQWYSSPGTLTSGDGKDGVWRFEINYAILNVSYDVDQEIEYYLVAQDNADNPNIGYVNNKAGIHFSLDSQQVGPKVPFKYLILNNLQGTVYVGKGQEYTSLTNDGGFFERANKSILLNDVTVIITSDISETGKHALYNVLSADTNKYTINIVPEDNHLKTINSNGAWYLLSFFGSERVVIDGSYKGSGKYLKFQCQYGSYNIGIQDAYNITIKNCYLESRAFSPAIHLLPSTFRSNKKILIKDNLFQERSNETYYPLFHIYSGNNNVNNSVNNSIVEDTSSIEITGNQFRNFALSGINIDSSLNYSKWTIKDNHLYNTVPVTISIYNNNYNYRHIPIYFHPGNRSLGNVISGNYIGGNSPFCKGSAYSSADYFGYFVGIHFKAGSGSLSLIENNIIKNIKWRGSWNYGYEIPVKGSFYGIYVEDGKVQLLNDSIGSDKDTGSITLIANYSDPTAAYGIINFSKDSVIINNCTIGSIKTASNSNYNGITAIAALAGTNVITNNIIGSKYIQYSICAPNLSSIDYSWPHRPQQNIIGILVNSEKESIVKNNTIANLYNYSQQNDSDITAGIFIKSNALIVENNISDIYSSSLKKRSEFMSVAGIISYPLSKDNSIKIENNNIYAIGLANRFYTSQHTIGGIQNLNFTDADVRITRNNIHNFSGSEDGLTVLGISNFSGRCTIENNMISLGYDTAGVSDNKDVAYFGIKTKSKFKDEIFFNSIYIGGDSVATDKNFGKLKCNTYAFINEDCKNDFAWNNIFFNARSNKNANESAKHGSINLREKNNFDNQSNLYYSSGNGGYFGSINSTTIRSYINNKNFTANLDTKPLLNDPRFINPAGNKYTVNLHVKDSNYIEGQGSALSYIFYDFDGDMRKNLTPIDVGADAGDFLLLQPFKPKANFTIRNICVTDTAYIVDSSRNAVTWLWYFGDGSTATIQSPKHKYTKAGKYNVKLVVTNKLGLLDSLTRDVFIDSTCVWPGDANADKIVSSKDILAIGIAYSDTGTVRADTSTIWKANLVDNWRNNFSSGANYKHADSDGSGNVSNLDTVAVTRNYTKTHAKKHFKNRGKNTDPLLKVKIDNDSLKAGDTLLAYIMLGDNALPAKDVYGIAFSLVYDESYFQDPVVDFTGSWLGTDIIGYSNKTNNLDIAITRIDQMNVSGGGRIAAIRLILKKDIDVGEKEVKLEITDNLLISAEEQEIPVNVEDDSVSTYKEPNSIYLHSKSPQPNINIYPNPFSGQTIIEYELLQSGKVGIAIYDVNGKVQLLMPLTTQLIGKHKFVLDADVYNIKTGIYVIKVGVDGNSYHKRIVKIE